MAKKSDPQAIAQRYTAALFELAQQEKTLEAVNGELQAIKTLFAESSAFARLCENPTINVNERAAAVAAIAAKAKISKLTAQFLNTLASNGRLEALPLIADTFQRRLHETHDELVAEVTSAVPLKKAQETRLVEMLKKHFGKKVALNIHVNESLLGGLRIRVAGQLIDASVAGRLQRVEAHLNTGIKQIV